MRGSPDAAGPGSRHGDDMNEGHHAHDGWAQEMHHLLMHGRDREASELAAHHLLDDPTHTEPARPDRATMAQLDELDEFEQLEELEPLLGPVASGITPDDLARPQARTPRASAGPPDRTSTTQPSPKAEGRASLGRLPLDHNGADT